MKFKSGDKDKDADDLLNNQNRIKKNRIIGLESQDEDEFEEIDLSEKNNKRHSRKKPDLNKIKKPLLIVISICSLVVATIFIITKFF